MSKTVTNYDGSISSTPQQLVRPKSVAELQNILKQRDKYPSPVRAMGSFHSLTPCVSSPGTIVDMKALDKIVKIDAEKMTFTAQAGLEMIEAAEALRKLKLQFILNIEIGNMTLGSAACCHTKDALDGVGFGQVNSFVTGVKWVSPSGELQEASEEKNPELLPLIRASYGLAGIVYEVTFRIKPLEIVRFDYEVLDVAAVTQDHVSEVIASNECMVCWTVGHKLVIQTRNRATELRHDLLAEARRFGWSFLGAFAGRAIRQTGVSTELTNAVEDLGRGHRARVLQAVERDRRLHALRPGQDDQLLQDAEVGPLCLHVLGVPAPGLGQEPERLRRLRRQVFRATTASAATCRSAPISSGRTPARCCRTPTTATSSPSTRSMRPATATRRRGTSSCARSTSGRRRAAAFRC